MSRIQKSSSGRLDAARSRPRAGGGPRPTADGSTTIVTGSNPATAFATAAHASRASSADAASSPSVFPTRGNAIHTRSCGAHSGGIVQVIVIRSLAVRRARPGPASGPDTDHGADARRASALVSPNGQAADSGQDGIMPQIPTVTLNDGTSFPELGLGTYNLRGEDGIAAIVAAIESGYRLLDTAVNYENEREVGEAVRRSGLDRDELLVTSKIPGRHHGREEAIASIEASLRELGLERIDLQLIHWPNPSVGKHVDTWRGMIDARERGLVRSIGVSNFTEAMLTELIDETGVTPAVNQVELHPYFPQDALRAFHAEHGIRTESWSPLARRSELLTEQILQELASHPRRDPDPGRAALARRARQHADSEVGGSRPAARERRRLRVLAHRRAGRRDLGARARPAVGRRPRHARGDVAEFARRASARPVSVEPWHPPPSTPSTTTSPCRASKRSRSRPTASRVVLTVAVLKKDGTAYERSLWAVPADGSGAPKRLTRSAKGEAGRRVHRERRHPVRLGAPRRRRRGR